MATKKKKAAKKRTTPKLSEAELKVYGALKTRFKKKFYSLSSAQRLKADKLSIT